MHVFSVISAGSTPNKKRGGEGGGVIAWGFPELLLCRGLSGVTDTRK